MGRVALSSLVLALCAGCARDVTLVDHSGGTTTGAASTRGSGGASVAVATSNASTSTGGCLTCADLGYECGLASDGCGHTLDCGTCPKCSACDDLQMPGKCVALCCPKTCADLGVQCGPTSD